MPEFPCPISITCPGSDDPITNYSAESLDQIVFGAPGFPIFPPDNPLGQDGSDPADPPFWFSQGCLGFCFSAESQQAADACAQINAYLCEQGQRLPPEFRPVAPVYYNTLQQCNFNCPDGSFFVAFVPPGRVAAGTQVLADRIAHEMACQFAATHFLCLPNINSACLDDPYSAQITMQASGAPYVFALTSGALPPGISLQVVGNRTAVIAGTPTAAGTYHFRLTVTDAAHNSVVKDYALTVLGITTSETLPAGDVGSAYNQALTALGGTPPYTFTLELGTLPDGLTLNDDGTITGTPTTEGNSSFVVAVADSGTAFCTKDFSLHINNVVCPVLQTQIDVIDISEGIAPFCATTDVLHPNKVFTGWRIAQKFHVIDADTNTDYTTINFTTGWNMSSAAYSPIGEKLFVSVQDTGSLVWTMQIVDAKNNALGVTIDFPVTGPLNGYFWMKYSSDISRVYCLNTQGAPADTFIVVVDPATNGITGFVCTVNPGFGVESANSVAYVPTVNRYYVGCHATGVGTSFLRGWNATTHVQEFSQDFFPDIVEGVVWSPSNSRLYVYTENNGTADVNIHVFNPATGLVEAVINLGIVSSPSLVIDYWSSKNLVVLPTGSGKIYFIKTSDNTVLCSVTTPCNFEPMGISSTKLFVSCLGTIHTNVYH